MTEEQKKKCDEIYKLYALKYINRGFGLFWIMDIFRCILILLGYPNNRLFMQSKFYIKLTVSLAKVFNRDITKKEAKEICNEVNNIINSLFAIPTFKHIFWSIANYFDNDNNKENENNE